MINDNYMKSGFKPAYRNTRYKDISGRRLLTSSEIVNLSSIPFK